MSQFQLSVKLLVSVYILYGVRLNMVR